MLAAIAANPNAADVLCIVAAVLFVLGALTSLVAGVQRFTMACLWLWVGCAGGRSDLQALMQALAEISDYELLIGPIDSDDEDRAEFLLGVASSVVAGVAPGVLPWIHYDPADPDAIDPGPVPDPVVLVTCQCASRLLAEPAGADGAVSMERIGWVQTAYDTGWTTDSGLLPAGWRLLLTAWRAPDLASIRLSVPHPLEYGLGGYGGDWWLWELEGLKRSPERLS